LFGSLPYLLWQIVGFDRLDGEVAVGMGSPVGKHDGPVRTAMFFGQAQLPAWIDRVKQLYGLFWRCALDEDGYRAFALLVGFDADHSSIRREQKSDMGVAIRNAKDNAKQCGGISTAVDKSVLLGGGS